jgi:hypothetical protein
LYVYNESTHTQRYEAIVHEVDGFTLKLGISDKISYIKNSKYDIEFNYDKTIFLLMHDALEKCAKNMSQYKHILFPESSNTIIKQKPIKMWFDRELNDEQKKAVSNIVSGNLSFANFFSFIIL